MALISTRHPQPSLRYLSKFLRPVIHLRVIVVPQLTEDPVKDKRTPLAILEYLILERTTFYG
jgi:hypothetical protein